MCRLLTPLAAFRQVQTLMQPTLKAAAPLSRSLHTTRLLQSTINQSMRRKATAPTHGAPQPRSPALLGNPQRKGVCSKIFVLTPKKPNSAQRRVARVKLSTGRSITAYIPGEGPSWSEHSRLRVTSEDDGQGTIYKNIALCWSGEGEKRIYLV